MTTPTSAPALEVAALRKSFGDTVAVLGDTVPHRPRTPSGSAPAPMIAYESGLVRLGWLD
jgi:hypothetical protein